MSPGVQGPAGRCPSRSQLGSEPHPAAGFLRRPLLAEVTIALGAGDLLTGSRSHLPGKGTGEWTGGKRQGIKNPRWVSVRIQGNTGAPDGLRW